jgi:hypothetical protein
VIVSCSPPVPSSHAGTWVQVGIPPRAYGPANFLLIAGESAAGQDVFVSYVAPLGSDAYVPPLFTNIMEVHSQVRWDTG